MTMQINIEEQLSFFLKINEELFHVENRWMQFFIWCNPDPVQIHASNIASGISVDDTIWVQHGQSNSIIFFNMGTILNTKVSRSILAPKDGPSR